MSLRPLVDSTDRSKVIVFEEGGMYWCALCADKPPDGECDCKKQICNACKSLHTCN